MALKKIALIDKFLDLFKKKRQNTGDLGSPEINN